MRKPLQAFVIFIFIIISSESQSQVCNYKYRKRITFNPAQVAGSSDLTNFPALINITSDVDLESVPNGGHVENANGYDIIFTAADGVTQLQHQLELYTATTGRLVVWVKIPVLSTTLNTDIYMYYGNTAIAADQSNTAMWSSYYGVWHLGGNLNDNSGNGFNATNNGTTNQNNTKIGNGRDLDGGDWGELTGFNNINTSFTISGWVQTDNQAKTGQRIFCDDVNNTGGYALSIGDGGSGVLRFYSRGSAPVILDSPANSVTTGNWAYCVGVANFTTGTKTLYVNGAQVASAAFSGWSTDAGNASLGGETAAGETANRFDGRLDEIRVCRSALSADWIATEYNNQNSPATFYTISSEPYRWTGGTSTNWGTGSNWVGNAVPPADADIIITNGTNQPTLDASRQIRSMWIQSSATVNQGANTLSFRYDITNCGTLTGATGTLTANSTSAFAQIEYISGTGVYNLNNLTVNNTHATNPQLTLMKDANVSGLLTLTSGIVNTTTTNILALGTNATSTSGLATSFVSGPMSKDGTANFVFPVGKGVKWRRAGIANITSATTFRVEYFDTPYASTTPVNAPLTNVSLVEYWQIDRTAGTGDANLSLYWEDASGSGINDCADLTIARWNGASWDERAGTAAGSCSGAGTGIVTSNAAITAFSPFTFGSKTPGGINPLPVELLEFSAIANNGKVDVKWITASEINNDYFTVERSKNGIDFETVQIVDGAGTSNQMLEYFDTDQSPLNGVSYYRLKQTDFNGDFSYSAIVPVNISGEGKEIGIYPNPSDGTNFNLEFTGFDNEEVLVVVRDIQGREYYSKVYILQSNSQLLAVDIENRLAPGTYLVVATSNNELLSLKLIVH